METIEWMMMAAFAAALLLSLWKFYAFFPNRPLRDDDTTAEAVEKLTELMLRCIVELFETRDDVTTAHLFERMVSHETFDAEHFWRFNPNRLNTLLARYFMHNPGASALEHIYEAEKERFR
jgi:hypothetical protein